MPLIVLRDYLELTYDPNIVDGERMVAYGRMIRVENLKGKVSKEFAYYRSLDGNPNQTKSWLYLSDIGDLNAANGISSYGESPPYIAHIPTSSNTAIDDDITNFLGDIDVAPETQNEMKMVFVEQVAPTIAFPSTGDIGVAKDDYNTATSITSIMPQMYAMFICKSTSQSGLMGWISSESTTDSLTWWATWLKENKYKYMANYTDVVNRVVERYNWELSEDHIIFNLDTINRINAELNDKAALERSSILRSIFRLLGIFLVFYSVIMIGCWALDINVDLGFNLLNRLTLGNYTAVASEAEIPTVEDATSSHYVGFQTVLKTSLIILSIGVLLITVDLVHLLILLINMLGSIASRIGSAIGGGM